MTRTRSLSLLLLVGLAAGCSTPVVDPAATHPIPEFTIPPVVAGQTYQRVLVFGDWGTGGPDQRATARAMVKRVAQLPDPKLDLMLSTGDNFYPHGVSSVDDPQWKTAFESVYADPLLQVPVWVTLGNHDYKGSVQAQLDYGKTNPRWKMPARYFSFTRPVGPPPAAGKAQASVEFFCLDTTPLGREASDATEQLAWLKTKLAASTARWKIAVGHHPIYSHGKRPYNRTLIKRLEPLFTKHGVALYLAGHDHMLELTKPFKGVLHLVSGAAGGPAKASRVRWAEKSLYAATRGGFVLLRIGADDLVIEFVRMNGQTQFAHTITTRN